MVNMTPAVPALSVEPPINGNGSTNGHSVSGTIYPIIHPRLNVCQSNLHDATVHSFDYVHQKNIFQKISPKLSI